MGIILSCFYPDVYHIIRGLAGREYFIRKNGKFLTYTGPITEPRLHNFYCYDLPWNFKNIIAKLVYSENLDDKYKGLCFFLYIYVHYGVYKESLELVDYVDHNSHGYIIVAERNISNRDMYLGEITKSEINYTITR